MQDLLFRGIPEVHLITMFCVVKTYYEQSISMAYLIHKIVVVRLLSGIFHVFLYFPSILYSLVVASNHP